MARRSTSRLPLALALVTTTAALAACSGGGGGAGGDADTIRVVDYYNNEPDNAIYQGILEACGKEAGVTIDRQSVPGGDLITTVLQQSSSRTLPDLLMLDNPDLPQIAASGALTPLGDFGLDGAGIEQGVLDASTYDGELYGIQPVTNTIALFVNTAILDEAGLEPPTTWDELRETAAALTDGSQYGVAFSAINTYEGTWQFLPFMWSNGGSESELDSPENAEALQLWVDLVSSGSASASVVNWSQADVKDQFAAGNAAMMVNGPWQFPTLEQVEGLDYEVVPLPVPNVGDELALPFGGETWTLPQTGDADRQEKAAEILACLSSDENVVIAATGRDTVPTDPELVDAVVAESERLAPFAELVPSLRARTGELGEEWPAAATAIYTAVQAALVSGQSPEDALAQAGR